MSIVERLNAQDYDLGCVILSCSITINGPDNYTGQLMRNSVWNTVEYTILVQYKGTNFENVSQFLILAVQNLPQNTAKIGKRWYYPF